EKDYVTAEDEAKKKRDSKNKDMETAVALLYGVKPNGKEDDTPLLEKAHPDVVVVSPAEDRMNGIAANDQQRQDIMMQIAMRPTNGKYQQLAFVTAHEDLLKTLTKASIALDREKYNDLSKVATTCYERLEKEAVAPLVLGIAGIVLAIGAISAINYSSNTAVNVATNAQQTQNELEDLRDVLGNELISNISRDLEDLKNYATKFANLPKISVLTKEDIPVIKEKYAKELKMAAIYRNVLEQFSRNIPTYIAQLNNTETQSEDNDSWDWWEKVKQVGRIFTPTHTGDVINAFEGLKEAIGKAITNVDFYVKSAEQYTPTVKDILAREENPVSRLVEKDKEEEVGSLGDLL